MGPGISEASKRCVECLFLRTPGSLVSHVDESDHLTLSERGGRGGCELGGGREGPIGLGLGSVDTPRISIGPAGYRINRD